MTKREFDAETKYSYGCPMAGDTKRHYRRQREFVDTGRDFVTYRAWRRSAYSAGPLFSRFMPWRTLASFRAQHGQSLLELSR